MPPFPTDDMQAQMAGMDQMNVKMENQQGQGLQPHPNAGPGMVGFIKVFNL